MVGFAWGASVVELGIIATEQAVLLNFGQGC